MRRSVSGVTPTTPYQRRNVKSFAQLPPNCSIPQERRAAREVDTSIPKKMSGVEKHAGFLEATKQHARSDHVEDGGTTVSKYKENLNIHSMSMSV
jgi:hypothetical protein